MRSSGATMGAATQPVYSTDDQAVSAAVSSDAESIEDAAAADA